jgi:hypothetical protein
MICFVAPVELVLFECYDALRVMHSLAYMCFVAPVDLIGFSAVMF